MAFKVMAFLLIFMVMGICVSPKAKAKDFNFCCCKTNEDCRDRCGVPKYHCNIGLCFCNWAPHSQNEIAEIDEGIN
ncbi:hypothetical protein P3L10_029606 [Capsicum annuum]